MSEPTYTLTLTDADRADMARVLGKLVTALMNAHIVVESLRSADLRPSNITVVESPSGGTQQARAVLSPPAEAPAAAPKPSPVELRDRWARDRKGNEVPNPAESFSANVNIWKTQQSKDGKYLRVTWQASEANGSGDANCFDQQLWPWLIKQAGQRTRLYLLRKGNYTNVVGVRA